MDKYEYKVFHSVTELPVSAIETRRSLSDALSEFGREGWRVIKISDDAIFPVIYLERKLDDAETPN